LAYIGQRPVIGRYIKLDQISSGFNGSNTGFSMTAGSQAVFPGTARNLILSLGGVIQEPDTDFTISGSTLTFTTPPVANTTFFAVIFGDMQSTGTPSDGTVLPASIASSGNFSFPQLTVTGTSSLGDDVTFTGASANIVFDKSDNALEFADNAKATFGTGADMTIKHDGSNSEIINATGSLLIDGQNTLTLRSAGNIIGQVADSETAFQAIANGAVELYYDNSKKLETTSAGATVTGSLTATGFATNGGGVTLNGANHNAAWVRSADTMRFNDNAIAGFGNADDLQIFHNGSQSYLNSTNGPIELRHTVGGANEALAKFNPNGSVELYHDGTKKLETTSTGVSFNDGNITNVGTIALDSIKGDADDNTNITFATNDVISFKCGSTSPALTVNTTQVKVEDNQKFVAGTGNDLQIFHDGSNNQINYSNGNLLIKQGSHSSSECLQFDSNGHLFVPDNELIYFGSGADLQIFHNGSHSFIKDSGTGDLFILSDDLHIGNVANTEDMAVFKENGAVELYFDNSKKFETRTGGVTITGSSFITGNDDHPDNSKARFGTSDDLQIYHDGTNSRIHNTTGALIVRTTSSFLVQSGNGGEVLIDADVNGGVELYHDNVKKFETYSAGIRATGNILTTTGDISCASDSHKLTVGASDDLQLFHSSDNSFVKTTNTNGNLIIEGAHGVDIKHGGENMARFKPDAAVELYFDVSKKFETTSYGALLTGNLKLGDSGIVSFGNNDDLQIFHNGDNSFIENDGTGSLFIRGGSSPIDIRAVDGEKSIEINAHSSVDLYHDGSIRFKTASAGLEFHNLTAGSGNSDLRYNSSNGAVFFDTSTILVKTNIENVPYGLDTLNKLQPRIYERTDCNNKVELGFIAEEVIKLIPEIVPTGRKSIYTKNESDTEIIPVNVDYRKLTVVLTKAVQELSAKVAALEAA